MEVSLGVTKLKDRFLGRIFSADQVENPKPAPDLYLYCADQMGSAAGATACDPSAFPEFRATRQECQSCRESDIDRDFVPCRDQERSGGCIKGSPWKCYW